MLVDSTGIEELLRTVSCDNQDESASLLVDYLGFGPLAPNMGLFHTVSSAQEHVNISFLSTGAFMGDGSAYRASLEKSLEEILLLQVR